MTLLTVEENEKLLEEEKKKEADKLAITPRRMKIMELSNSDGLPSAHSEVSPSMTNSQGIQVVEPAADEALKLHKMSLSKALKQLASPRSRELKPTPSPTSSKSGSPRIKTHSASGSPKAGSGEEGGDGDKTRGRSQSSSKNAQPSKSPRESEKSAMSLSSPSTTATTTPPTSPATTSSKPTSAMTTSGGAAKTNVALNLGAVKSTSSKSKTLPKKLPRQDASPSPTDHRDWAIADSAVISFQLPPKSPGKSDKASEKGKDSEKDKDSEKGSGKGKDSGKGSDKGKDADTSDDEKLYVTISHRNALGQEETSTITINLINKPTAKIVALEGPQFVQLPMTCLLELVDLKPDAVDGKSHKKPSLATTPLTTTNTTATIQPQPQ